jgi:hypothetical protein
VTTGSTNLPVTVDEYDKPILHNLADRNTARQLRDGLRNLYSVHLVGVEFSREQRTVVGFEVEQLA